MCWRGRSAVREPNDESCWKFSPSFFFLSLSLFPSPFLSLSLPLSPLVLPRRPPLAPARCLPSPITPASDLLRGLGRYRGPRGCRGRRPRAPAPPPRSSRARPARARTPGRPRKDRRLGGRPAVAGSRRAGRRGREGLPRGGGGRPGEGLERPGRRRRARRSPAPLRAASLP